LPAFHRFCAEVLLYVIKQKAIADATPISPEKTKTDLIPAYFKSIELKTGLHANPSPINILKCPRMLPLEPASLCSNSKAVQAGCETALNTPLKRSTASR
jgi:hypothetical protein